MLYFGSLKVVYMHICIYIMFCMVFENPKWISVSLVCIGSFNMNLVQCLL